MTETKAVLLLYETGPDIRQFLYSGLALDLAKYANVIWALGNLVSKKHLPNEDKKIHISSIAPSLPFPLKLVSRLAEASCNLRQESRFSQHQWLNFIDSIRSKKKSLPVQFFARLLSSELVFRILLTCEHVFFYSYPIQDVFLECIADLGIAVIVLSSYSTPSSRCLIWLARRCGIRTVVMLNSWKDAFARSHISIAPNVLIVPSQNSADILLQANPGLPSAIYVLQSLHTTHLSEPGLIINRASFCALYKLDPEIPILCITAAAPSAVPDEIEIISDLISRLGTDLPQVLIRLNPMEDDPSRWELLARHPRVSLQVPDWDYVASAKMSVPRPEDASIWASTIYHSTANLSVPSTVTTDFLFFNKPVINICFDSHSQPSPRESICRFWEAPFYASYRHCARVFPTFSAEELAFLIKSHFDVCSSLHDSFPDPFLASQARNLRQSIILGDNAVNSSFYPRNL